MNCQHVRALLSAYLDSELTGYEMLNIRDHLTHCNSCDEERNSIECVRSMVRSLPQREPRSEWLVALQQEAFYASLPLGTRLLAKFVQDPVALSLHRRRIASAAMLSVIGVFMAAATFENVPVHRQPNVGNLELATGQPRIEMPEYMGGSIRQSMTANEEIQLLDPRQHPADLTSRETSLALLNIMEPQARYNNVTLTSFPSMGNQFVSSR